MDRKMNQGKFRVKKEILGLVWGQVRVQAWGKTREQINREQIWDQVRDLVSGPVESQLRVQVWDQLEVKF